MKQTNFRQKQTNRQKLTELLINHPDLIKAANGRFDALNNYFYSDTSKTL